MKFWWGKELVFKSELRAKGDQRGSFWDTISQILYLISVKKLRRNGKAGEQVAWFSK